MQRFFQSKLEDSTLKAEGTYDLKVEKQRRKNRVVKVCVRSKIYHGALFIIMSVLHFTEIRIKESCIRAHQCPF